MLGQEFCQEFIINLSTLSGDNVLPFIEGCWEFLLARTG